MFLPGDELQARCVVAAEGLKPQNISHQEKDGYYGAARVTIENFWARRGRDAGETRARTFTNFDRGTVDFRHMGVLVSRICTKVYSEESFGDLSILSHSIE